MSEFIAEARVAIIPDLTQFRSQLDAQLREATSGVFRTSGQQQLVAANSALSRSSEQVTGTLVHQKKVAEETRGALLGLGNASGRLDAALLGLRTAVGSQAVIGLGAGALAAIAFGKAIRSVLGLTAQFETELNVFQATTGATADQMRLVSAAAERLGSDITLPAVSAGDAAEAMTELAKAGLTVQDAIRGARGVLELATAAAISNAQATELAASALNAFGLAGDQAVRVADVLANASNEAQGSISDMGLALSQAAAVGRQVGLSLEDTTSFLTILAREGLRGSDAGTSLRVALIRLVNPTKEAADELRKLGVNIRDARGNLRPDFFTNLGIALQGMSKAQRDATLALIGGQDAVRALSILSRQSITDVIGVRDALAQQGTAADIAAARSKGLAGAGANLSNTLQTIGIEIGQHVAPALTRYTNELAAGIAATAQNEQVQRLLAQSTSAVGDAFSILGAIIGSIAPALLATASALESVTAAVGVGPILAAVAAYKLIPRILLTASLAANAFAGSAKALQLATIASSVSLTRSAGVLTTLRAGLAATGASLAAFATSTAGVGLIAAGLAVGIGFLVTREGELEKANRRLKESSDALVSSLAAQQAAHDQLAATRSNLGSEQIALSSARIAQAQARAALSSSSAPTGSLERAQLENQLAVATDNVRLAEERLAQTRKDLTQQTQVANEADRNAARDRRENVRSVNELVAAQTNLDAITRLQRTDRSATTAVEAEAEARRNLIIELQKQASADAASLKPGAIDLAARKRALADIIELTGRIPKTSAIDKIFSAPNASVALQQVRELGSSLGQIRPQELADRFQNATGRIAIALKDGVITPIEIVRLSASNVGRSFLTGFAQGNAALQRVIATVRQLTVELGRPPTKAELYRVLQRALDAIKGSANGAGAAVSQLGTDAAQSAGGITAITKAANEASTAVSALGRASAQASDRLLRLQAEGAGAPAQLQAAQEQLRADQAILAQKRAIPVGTPGRSTAIRAAERAVIQDREEVKRLQGEIQSQAQDNAQKAKDASDKVAAAREAQNQAIISVLQTRETQAEARISQATTSRQVNRAVKDAFDAARTQFRAEVAEIKRTVDDAKVAAAQIAVLTVQYKQTLAKIRAERKQQQDAIRQQRQSALDQRLEALQIRIQTAGITGNKALQERLLNAEIAELERQIRGAKRGSIKRLQLIQELRQAQKDLADLKKEQDKATTASNAFKTAQFEFLQAQQGFAANLLGNLIPLGATGGLVGNVSPSAGSVISGTATGAIDTVRKTPLQGTAVGDELRRHAAIKDSTNIGPTRVGQSTELTILREIRNLLRQIHRGNGHPEAAYRRHHNRNALNDYGHSGSHNG